MSRPAAMRAHAGSRSGRDAAAALAVAAAVVVLQLPFRSLGVSLLDEGASLQIAAELAHGRVPYVDNFHYVFPGVFYLTAAAFVLGGTSIESARMLVVLLFAATTAVAYLMARWFVGVRGALAAVAAFLVYRVWAYPHWQTVSYPALAMALLLFAACVLGFSLDATRRRGVAVAGLLCGLAVLAKQDSGSTGTAALGLAVLLLRRDRLPSALAFGAGWLCAVGGAVGALVFLGAGPAFLERAVLMPLRAVTHFDYPARPALWPLWTQDAAMRANVFSYAPPILVELYWGALMASRLYRETSAVDVALKLVFYFPWILLLAAGGVAVARAVRGQLGPLRARRQVLLVLLAAGAAAAFNRPQDWSHCLVLYPPTILLLFAVGRPLVRRRVAAAAGWLGLGLAVAASAALAIALDRRLDTPIRSPRGVLRATRPQAESLQPLLDRLAATPPGTPLAALPYHPLLNFLADRPTVEPFTVLWPADPPAARDAEIMRRLAARPDTVVVYSPTEAPHLPRFQAFAPTLFEFLVDRYDVDEVFGGGFGAYTFLLLGRRPPPAGTSLLGPALATARVAVEGPAAPGGDPRGLVGEALWPFARVLRMTTLPETRVTVAYRVVPAAGERLETRYGINPVAWIDLPPPRARFTIAVREGGLVQEVWSDDVAPMTDPHDRRWARATVDLAPWAGRAIELVLGVVAPAGAAVRRDLAGWADPRLVTPSEPSAASPRAPALPRAAATAPAPSAETG